MVLSCLVFICSIINGCISPEQRNEQLIDAIKYNDQNKVAALIVRGADVNYIQDELSPLCVAAMFGSTEIAKDLMVAGAEVQPTGARKSPLHLAAFFGNVELVKTLLEAGASVNSTQAEYGMTPLQQAVSTNQRAVVEYLLQAGADIMQKDSAGRTAYDIAVQHSFNELAAWLQQEMQKSQDAASQ